MFLNILLTALMANAGYSCKYRNSNQTIKIVSCDSLECAIESGVSLCLDFYAVGDVGEDDILYCVNHTTCKKDSKPKKPALPISLNPKLFESR